MSELKTKPGMRTVNDFLASLDAPQRAQADVLIDMMQKASGEPAVMWGESIVGFGSYTYVYSSGRSGDWLRIGFSPRKGKVSLYLTMEAQQYQEQVDALGGKTSIGKGCIYLQRFDEVDKTRLYDLIDQTYKDSLKSSS